MNDRQNGQNAARSTRWTQQLPLALALLMGGGGGALSILQTQDRFYYHDGVAMEQRAVDANQATRIEMAKDMEHQREILTALINAHNDRLMAVIDAHLEQAEIYKRKLDGLPPGQIDDNTAAINELRLFHARHHDEND